jgi:beta-phosphoglucomutase-like phosphatase (HAD superfamily)
MRQSDSKRVSRDQYDAVLFDLDGVITNTANLHAACWKQMFDEYLQKRATQRGEAFRPFDLATDYRLYVDGKPRFDGVRDFLTSRPRSSKQWAGSGTARTTWSTGSLKKEGWSLTREASN